jgi:N-acetylmuramoyl-L-alanine amidase
VCKLIIHWTANPGATAANHFAYFDKSIIEAKRYASAHIFVDKTEAICIVPLNEVAYQANDGSFRGVPELMPNANFLAIGVELCVEKDGTIHADTTARAVDVFAELCRTYKLDPARDIVRHYDVTHKNCPAPWVADSKPFEAFKAQVAAKLNPPKPVVEVKAVETVPAPAKTQTIQVLVGNLATYKTPNWNDKSGPVVHKGDVFTIKRSLVVAGSKMYELKSGLFITANPKYIKTKG